MCVRLQVGDYSLTGSRAQVWCVNYVFRLVFQYPEQITTVFEPGFNYEQRKVTS